MAKASGEGRASPLVRPPSCGKDPYEPWDMTTRERELSTKYLRLMTYHVNRYKSFISLTRSLNEKVSVLSELL